MIYNIIFNMIIDLYRNWNKRKSSLQVICEFDYLVFNIISLRLLSNGFRIHGGNWELEVNSLKFRLNI